MKIKDLRPNLNVAELSATIKEKGEIREFSKFGRIGKVCDIILSDGTGEVHMPIWDEQIDNYNEDDKIKIANCYVKYYKGKMQISAGKIGTINII